MKRELLFIVLCCFCCGDEQETRIPVYQELPRCLNCGQDYVPDEPDIPDPRPRVYLQPNELLFYFTTDDEEPYPPQYIDIVNTSKGNVIIIDAFIAKDEECYICGDDIHFELTEPNLPQVLEDGESLQLEVHFSCSTSQEGAILKVYTSFAPDEILQARLSGKVFVW